ncbi:MAG: WG repeat-containing protein [Prevotella sp.]|nr:WG repeat-containing protein [Prevotella sp.]
MKYTYTFILFLLFTCSICAQTNDVVVKRPGENYTIVGDLGKSGLRFVMLRNKCGYIDEAGNVVVPLKYDYNSPYDYVEKWDDQLLVRVKRNGKYGYINNVGREVISPIYEETDGKNYGRSFDNSDDVIKVKMNGKYGFVGINGNTIIPIIYEDLQFYNTDIPLYAKRNGKYGFIDTSHNVLIPFFYTTAGCFTKKTRLAPVSQNGKYGFINEKGERVISFQYEFADVFWGSIAAVVKNKKLGFIDRFGNISIPFIYDVEYSGHSLETYWAFSDDDALIPIRKNGKWGGIDKQGNVVVAFDYDGVHTFNMAGEYFGLKKSGNNTIFYFDKNGTMYTSYQELRNSIRKKKNPSPIYQKANMEWITFEPISTSKDYSFKIGVKSDSKIEDVSVYVNGILSRGTIAVRNDGYNMTIDRTVALNDGQNTVKVTVKNASGTASTEKTVTYQNQSIATIDWLTFSPTTTEKQYSLKAGIKSASKIVSWNVMLNGVVDRGINPVHNDGYAMTIDKKLTLSEGNNTIKIEVRNAGGVATMEKNIIYHATNNSTNLKEKRIALVIGNEKYESNSFPNLPNALNDARSMYAKLESLGFEMSPIVLNGTRVSMWNAIENFVDKIDKGNYDVVLVYYSGHGLSPDGGANYMIPVDAKIRYLDEIKRDAINTQTELIRELEKKNCKVKIALLDCCNNCNVADRGARSATYQGGLSKMNPEGVYILHAAHPGKTARDGSSATSRNSPFAEALIECVDENPNMVWELFVKEVIEKVESKTNGEQIPYPEGLIKGKFYFNKK